MSQTPLIPAPSPTLGHDHPCCTCGYNLRTLRRDALCPECATPVGDSLRSWLSTRDPRWLRRMARGTALLFPLPLLVPLAIAARFGFEWHLAALALVYSMGLWLIASRDRRFRGTDEAAVLGITARFCAVVLPAILVLLTIDWFHRHSIRLDSDRVFTLIYGILALSHACAFLLLMTVARRIPDPRLTRSVLFALFSTVAPLALMIAIIFIGWPDEAWFAHLLVLAILTTAWANITLGRFVQLFRQAANRPPTPPPHASFDPTPPI